MEGIVFVWLLLSVGVAVLADSRGRNGWGYLLLSIVFSPLVGLIAVLVTSNLREEAKKVEEQKREEAKKVEEQKREHEVELESIRAIAGSVATARGAPRITSIAEELEKLAVLRDKGILTEQEFSEQKAALLHPNQT